MDEDFVFETRSTQNDRISASSAFYHEEWKDLAISTTKSLQRQGIPTAGEYMKVWFVDAVHKVDRCVLYYGQQARAE